MISALTPEELIRERVAAFERHDFKSIFHSYYHTAPFLHFFPDCDAYIAYAEVEISGTFQIKSCQILRSCQKEETAKILFRQRVVHQGILLDSLEIARCHRDALGLWFFVAGLRLDTLKLPVDFSHCSWSVLLAAGNDLWI